MLFSILLIQIQRYDTIFLDNTEFYSQYSVFSVLFTSQSQFLHCGIRCGQSAQHQTQQTQVGYSIGIFPTQKKWFILALQTKLFVLCLCFKWGHWKNGLKARVLKRIQFNLYSKHTQMHLFPDFLLQRTTKRILGSVNLFHIEWSPIHFWESWSSS